METNFDHPFLSSIDLKPIKHRKFIEILSSDNFSHLLPYLYTTSDVTFASRNEFKQLCVDFSKEFEKEIQSTNTISFDFHAFHTNIIP